MIIDYIDIIISLVLGTVILVLSKTQLAKVLHKSDLSDKALKLIRVGGVVIILGAIASVLSDIIYG